jgi:hypothetical protein
MSLWGYLCLFVFPLYLLRSADAFLFGHRQRFGCSSDIDAMRDVIRRELQGCFPKDGLKRPPPNAIEWQQCDPLASLFVYLI